MGVLRAIVAYLAAATLSAHGEDATLDACHQLYSDHGFQLVDNFEAFAGYLVNKNTRFDPFSRISESTSFLNGTMLWYVEPDEWVHKEILDGILRLLKFTQETLQLDRFPPLAFHLNSKDGGEPKHGKADLESRARPDTFCMHAAGVNFATCSGTIALPIHGNQYAEILAKHLKESETLEAPAWDERKHQAIWRGGPHSHRGERQKLLMTARTSKGLIDAAYGYLDWKEVVRYKAIVAVDGFGPFSGMLKRSLLSGSPTIVVGHYSGLGEWFEPFLKPFTHYIPSRFDMGDLREKVEWTLNNKEAALNIAQNAKSAASFLFQARSLACYTYASLSYWSSLQSQTFSVEQYLMSSHAKQLQAIHINITY